MARLGRNTAEHSKRAYELVASARYDRYPTRGPGGQLPSDADAVHVPRVRAVTPDVLPAEAAGPLFGLVYDDDYRGRPMLVHLPNYHIVWRRGVAGTCLIDYRFGTVRRRADLAALPAYNEFLRWHPYRDEYRAMPYLLVRGPVPPEAAPLLSGFRRVRSKGTWSLWERPRSNGSPAVPRRQQGEYVAE